MHAPNPINVYGLVTCMAPNPINLYGFPLKRKPYMWAAAVGRKILPKASAMRETRWAGSHAPAISDGE